MLPADCSTRLITPASPGRRRLLAAALLAVSMTGAGVALAESRPADDRTLRERHAQVVKMSQVERDHLQRNMAAFQQMTPEQQEHYRRLDEQLADDKKGGGQLSSLLQTYSAWLQTLTPAQREALRLETDSARKLALVQKFKEEQYRRVETFVASQEVDSGPVRPFGMPKLMSEPELNAVMKTLLTALPDEDQRKFGKTPQPDQYVEILRRSIQNAEDGPRAWPDEALQERLVQALPNQARMMIRRSSVAQREKIVGYLLLSLMRVAEEARPRFPSDEDLQRFVGELDERQRTQLQQRPPEEMKRELRRRYMEQNDRRLQELRNAVGRVRGDIGLMQRGDAFPPRPPAGRRPDDRNGPGERNKPGERIEPHRENPRPGDRPRRDEKDPPPRESKD